MRQSNDGMLGAMPVPRLVVTMSLPIMLSMLISAVYNLVDSVYVAQYSDEAFLALSYAYPIQMLLVAFCSGIGVGFSAIFSRRLGEGRPGTGCFCGLPRVFPLRTLLAPLPSFRPDRGRPLPAPLHRGPLRRPGRGPSTC